MKKSAFRDVAAKAFSASLPVMAGYVVLGTGFGIIMNTNGYGFIWSLAMGLMIYAGSMQYVAIDLLTGGASLIAAALTTFMVNARHLFYGLSMIDKYKNAGRKKLYMIFALTDETYSLVCGDVPVDEKFRHIYSLLVSAFNHTYWVTGCALGGLVGGYIPFSTEGVDFALTALFVTVFVEQWLSTRDHAAALIGLGASAACLAVFGSEGFLIPSMIAIALALTVMRLVRKEAARE